MTGGGTEFVRQVSKQLYGVEPGMVVGTLIGYRFDRDDAGRPVVRRTISQIGKANEGGAKLENIQSQIGRAPILAVGNSGGDREMLEWAQRKPPRRPRGPREPRRRASASSPTRARPRRSRRTSRSPTVADRLGWVVVSMQRDWETVFPVV